MMELHPFGPERRIGHVFQVEGSFADIALSAANKLPRAHFGEYLGRGEVGEFVVIDVGGVAAFGRLLQVGTALGRADDVSAEGDKKVPIEGRVQLLSTLELSGATTRGIARYPKVGDAVYAASSEAILAVIGAASSSDTATLPLGRLSVDESVPVAVPLSRLFGRHLAVVGATGSGKSWTVGHLAESVAALRGKMILIDATGEFRTLAERATHLAFSSAADEPDGTTVVGIPHFMMRESDRNAFLNPSSGSQLPKLREAVRSLRLAHAITADAGATPAHQRVVQSSGEVVKRNGTIAVHQSACNTYIGAVEGANSPFNIRLLAAQVQNECIWGTDKNNSSKFGDVDQNSLGYVSSLVSRISDLLQTPEIMDVIDPPAGVVNVIEEIWKWIHDHDQHVLRISLKNLTFANHLREIVVNILGQTLLTWAREGAYGAMPVVVAVDEAHQFFDVTVGDEFASTHLNAFDAIAKEGRKYGLTVCVATQRPSDLPAGVLSQVGMTIVHRLADGRDRQRVEQAAAELDHSATKLLPGLVPGEAILMGVDFPVPVSVRIQKPVAPPASDGPSYDCWGA
ncbi:AAA-like domain protein [Microbacterium azadirachtae]|uniref:AAA-like domain protein n=1 Tax=Microbacterium azadirachtae TaxID=582680 RepID=A0A0F0KXR2_9MICO|nr:ATP-binding protein [Microbacterium azadirachtae]KJL24885.1 AAA-like domain protein [Microbacterium azadirachtae]